MLGPAVRRLGNPAVACASTAFLGALQSPSVLGLEAVGALPLTTPASSSLAWESGSRLLIRSQYTAAPDAWQAEASTSNALLHAPPAEHGRQRHHTPTPAVPSAGPMAAYEAGKAKGLYRPDPRQQRTIEILQTVYEELQQQVDPSAAGGAHRQHHQGGHSARGAAKAVRAKRPSGLTIVDSMPGHKGHAQKQSWWSGLLGGRDDNDSDATAAAAVKGVYMFGGVGCGKTMLMDLFVHTCPAEFRVLRTHFHDFMLDVHSQLRKHSGDADPLVKVADTVAGRCKVLALDELFVTDVADAMILNRLFRRLWERGLVLVATSNRHPDELYKGGLQRDLFMPFIHLLKAQCVVHDMASSTDYRRLAQHQRGLYFVSPTREMDLDEAFSLAAGGQLPEPEDVEVMMGRAIHVPAASGKCCMFNFADLCGRPVAAADYLALVGRYHTLALAGVPAFGAANRSEAYRFVTLIDVMYEHRTRLLCSAEAMPFELFERVLTHAQAQADPGFLKRNPEAIVDDNLGFSKDRTVSRLTEMQSLEYLVAHAQAHAPELLLALQEVRAGPVTAARRA